MRAYFIVGAVIAAGLIICSTSRSFRDRLLLSLPVLLAATIVTLSFEPSQFLDGGSWFQHSPQKEVCLFVAMILGMSARTLSVAIQAYQRAPVKTRKLKVDLWDFVLPFLVSFITFGAVVAAVGGEELGIRSLVFAFQNGFFWQTLIKSK